jgi:hypothetical protein
VTNARKQFCKNIGKNLNNFVTQQQKYSKYKGGKKVDFQISA